MQQLNREKKCDLFNIGVFHFFASTLKITEQGMMVHKGNSCQIMAEDHCDSEVLISMIGIFLPRNLEKI